MPKLILQNNYLLNVDNISCSKKIRKLVNKHYKLIRNGSKLVFTDGELTITLWGNHRSCGYYCCYITLQKNNTYRTTKYELNSRSVYIWINIYSMELDYLKSYSCITTLDKFLFLVDFYNKANVKKKLVRVSSIKNAFRNSYIARYISEFL